MNFNDAAILNLAENVANSIQAIFDTNSTTQQRHNATVFCEDFRTRGTSIELCTVGFTFVSRFQSSHAGMQNDHTHTLEPQLALVGMQFVEDVVKFRWPQFDERALVKGYIIEMMKNGLVQNPSQANEIPHYLHEMIARIIVEIAKREWPQFWPDLFPTLLQLLPTSDLPLLILRRLAEDVFVLQRVNSANRRKDLSQCLHVVCDEVLKCLFNALRDSLTQFQAAQSELLKRRINTILQTIEPFVEWSKISCFTNDNRMQTLFSLLLNESFRLEAADCIVELVERKTLRKEERYDIPNACLSPYTFSYYLSAVTGCQTQDEELLKKLGNILTALCGSSLGVEELAAGNLLKGMTAMASRTEAVSVLAAILGTNSFMKMVTKELVDTKDWLKTGLVNVLEPIVKKCTSPPIISERRETIRIRQEFPTLLRKIGKVLPDLYLFISSWLRNYLADTSKVEAYQWDALIMVMGSIQAFLDEENVAIINLGLQDLELCFTKFAAESNLKTKSFILSGVSALFVFLSLAKSRNEFTEGHSRWINSILEELFNCFPHDHVSQHAASLMVKLCADFPDLILPSFDIICASTIKLTPSIKPSEYQRLVEALVLLSNRWNDPWKQSSFISQLINPSDWQQISDLSKNPQLFAQMFREESLFVKGRQLLNNLSICYGILRRANLKSENLGVSDQVLPSAPHPVITHFIPVISTSLEYIKTVHSLLQIPEFKFIMDISNSEMCQLMGITQWSTDAELKLVNAQLETLVSSEDQKVDNLKVKFQDMIKKFVRTSLEAAYGIVGHSFSVFSPDIYMVPQIGDMILQCVAGHADLLDDYRLYIITRNVFKYFLLSCPPSAIDSVVKPFLQNFLQFMLNRLQARWEIVNNGDGSEGDIKEVLENCALRLLTKEFLEIVQLLLGYSKTLKPKLTSAKDVPDGNANANDNDSDADMEMDADVISAFTPAISSASASSEAPNVLLEDEICSKAILHLCLMALSWSDKLVNVRASRCLVQCWPVISKDPQILHTVFVECLRGILVLDDSETRDALQKVLLVVCSTSLEKDPAIAQILLEWGARESDVKKLLSTCQSAISTSGRGRKDCLRKMIRNNPNIQSTKGAREKWLNNLPKVTIYNLAERIEQSVNLTDCSTEIHQTT